MNFSSKNKKMLTKNSNSPKLLQVTQTLKNLKIFIKYD